MTIRRGLARADDGMSGRWILAIGVLINLFVVAQVVMSLRITYLQTRGRAEVVAGDLLKFLDQSLAGVIDKIDLSLLAVSQEVAWQRAAGGLNREKLGTFIARQKERCPEISSLRTVNAAGVVEQSVSSPAGLTVSIADRDYFAHLRDDPNAGLVLSKPLRGRISDDVGMTFARRLDHPDGSFAGIVYAGVTADHLLELLATIDVGARGSVSLRDADFSLVARFPRVPGNANVLGLVGSSREFQKAVLDHPEGGLYRAHASIDDVDRIFAYRFLPEYHLFLIVGLGVDDFFAEWRSGAATMVGFALLFVIISLFVGYFIHRTWRIRGAALQEARIANARLQAILQNSPVGLAIIGLDRTVQLANKTMLDMFEGDGQGERQPAAVALPALDKQLDTVRRRAYPTVLSGGTFEDEGILHRQDGSVFWCKLKARLLDITQPALGIAWVAEDIGNRRRNEQQLALYRNLIEFTSDCVYVISPRQGFRMIFANDATCSHYGVPREELLNWRMSEWDVDFADEEALDDFWHQVKQKKSLLIQTRHRVHSKAVVAVEMSANYLLHEGEEFIGGYFHNIVGRMVAERALMEKSQELARSNTDLEQFAYVASHDLREPLRMVASYLGLLERRLGDQLTGEAREFVAYAKDGAQRMDRLILDLLDYSRIGRTARPHEPVSLADVMAEVRLNLTARIEEVGGVLEIGEELPTVTGDRIELVRLFQNLVANALKYHAPDRPPVIRISARQERKEWIVSVADNGIGIPPQYFERIFGIFQRLHGRDDYDGTGIGLAICKRIVERLGGRIWVQSEPGQGAEFFVAFGPVSVPSLVSPSAAILS
ncbi:ATP-binding protein [Telmatospirillum sp.]|uniref:ATP-binding protein n=1 Tax=Telmatospirillum sp. TaxID=2079197 RepID=UPI00283F2BDB|nr:ATP-binding protein [Telmatospirillum sp.]MDR3438397.1 ATP-binding protein [Telmatospirillum sp.]